MKSVINDFFVDWKDTRNILNNNKQNNRKQILLINYFVN